jgi:oxygen-dependent protoporphyrinogen oxidase
MMTMSGLTFWRSGYLISMQARHYKNIVLGAGISGLTAALELQAKGLDVVVLEKSGKASGVLQSIKKDGFAWDRAAHTIAVDQEVKSFLERYGVSKLLVKPSDVAKVRQIAIKDEIWDISSNPLKIFGAPFLSFNAKLKLVRELFKAPIKSDNPTVYEFFEYHFGSEITQNIISAVFAGIYAGNIEQMEMKSVMAKVYEIEQGAGSIIRGLIKNKGSFGGREIFGLKGGMEALGHQLAERLENICYGTSIHKVERRNGKYHVETSGQEFTCDHLISTLPSYALEGLISELSPNMQKMLKAISYEPMVLIHVGFPGQVHQVNSKAFGFLCSQYDSPVLKGALYNSDLFEERAPSGFDAYTIFMKPKIKWLDDEDKLEVEVLRTVEHFKRLTHITTEATIIEKSVWRNAIPQFNRPYAELKSALLRESREIPGFTLSGSYISGVSVPDCIKYNMKLASELSV